MNALKLGIIIASVREGRIGERIGRWIESVAKAREDLSVRVFDLKEWPIPHYTEPKGAKAMETSYSSDLLKRWVAAIAEQEAFVVVTPEYNHGYPGQLKDAMDHVYAGWTAKPIGFVGYGGISGGIRSIQQLRQVVVELQMVPVREEVNLPFAMKIVDEKGTPHDPYFAGRAENMFDQLVWWGRALAEARAKTPFPTPRGLAPPK
jgi:NAD(P)H-dependent FMN reductase